jgi:hypothetical protein
MRVGLRKSLRRSVRERAQTAFRARAPIAACGLLLLAATFARAQDGTQAPPDVCSGIQGDAEYLKRQVEDSIKQVRDALFFQREEDASAQALQDQCKGRKDASPQCQVIAADLEARTALRKQNQTKVQALMGTLQYYRTEYDQAKRGQAAVEWPANAAVTKMRVLRRDREGRQENFNPDLVIKTCNGQW